MGFFKDIYGLLGPGSHPASLGIPCAICEKRLAWIEELPPGESSPRVEECRKICDYALYFDRFGIDKSEAVSEDELDYLVEWIETRMLKRSNGIALSELELEQLRVWAPRLSLVVAMQEAKIAAAYSTLENISEVTG